MSDTLRLIIDGNTADAIEIVSRMVRERESFTGENSRSGWGWRWNISGREYFVRTTKTGISAKLLTASGAS